MVNMIRRLKLFSIRNTHDILLKHNRAYKIPGFVTIYFVFKIPN